MNSVIPASTSWSTMTPKIVLPAMGIRALGCVYVSGRNLVPAPATGIIAFTQKRLSRENSHFPACCFKRYNLVMYKPACPAILTSGTNAKIQVA